MTIKQRDRKHVGRDSEPDDFQVTRAEGSRIFDANGKSYIDFTSGWCVSNLGWGDEEVRAQLRRFKGPSYVAPTLNVTLSPTVTLWGAGSRVIVGRALVCARASLIATSRHAIQHVKATNREVRRRLMGGRRNAPRSFVRRSMGWGMAFGLSRTAGRLRARANSKRVC